MTKKKQPMTNLFTDLKMDVFILSLKTRQNKIRKVWINYLHNKPVKGPVRYVMFLSLNHLFRQTAARQKSHGSPRDL